MTQKQIKVQPYQEHDKALNKLVEYHKAILEKKAREIQKNIDDESIYKKKAVQEVGKFLEKSRMYKLNTISSTITKLFQGYIYRGYVQECCDPEWKQPRKKDGNWKNKYTSKAGSGQNYAQKTSFEETPQQVPELTPEQRQQRHANEYNNLVKEDKELADTMDKLTNMLSGMSQIERGHLSMEAPKGTNIRRLIMEKSKDHRFRIRKRQSEYMIRGFLGPAQELKYLLDDFIEQLDEELGVSKDKPGV